MKLKTQIEKPNQSLEIELGRILARTSNLEVTEKKLTSVRNWLQIQKEHSISNFLVAKRITCKNFKTLVINQF